VRRPGAAGAFLQGLALGGGQRDRHAARQCEGCTTTAWHLKDAVYLNAHGVSLAILTTGRWDEVASYAGFMGYTQSWRSDADGNATWGPTSRPVPQWTRPGATPVETLGRHGHGT